MKKNFLIPAFGVLLIIAGLALIIFVISSSAINDKSEETHDNSENQSVVSENQDTEENVIKETLAPTDETTENDFPVEQENEIISESETLVETDTTVEEPVSEVTEETEPQPAASTGTGETSEEPETTETESESVEAQTVEAQHDDNQNEEIVYFDGTTKVDTSLWNMILVNPDNYLPDGFTIDKMQVQGNYYLDSRVAPYAIQMIADAKKDGIDLQICSSIRDIDMQTRLFNNKIDDLIEEGYSKEDARRVAATIVAVPGTSEHHTGLAMDVVTPSYQRLNSGYANTDAAKWLKANAAKYGFILRYPEDKTEITKIIFEPWHYRYVGVEYASFIMSEGICFEEFIELYGETDQ